MADTPDTTKPEQPAKATKPAETPETVRLAVAHPHDVFNHGIDGVEPITADGVDVPASKEQAVRDAAKAADVKIRKVN